jgi:hypothetical protein
MVNSMHSDDPGVVFFFSFLFEKVQKRFLTFIHRTQHCKINSKGNGNIGKYFSDKIYYAISMTSEEFLSFSYSFLHSSRFVEID